MFRALVGKVCANAAVRTLAFEILTDKCDNRQKNGVAIICKG